MKSGFFQLFLILISKKFSRKKLSLQKSAECTESNWIHAFFSLKHVIFEAGDSLKKWSLSELAFNQCKQTNKLLNFSFWYAPKWHKKQQEKLPSIFWFFSTQHSLFSLVDTLVYYLWLRFLHFNFNCCMWTSLHFITSHLSTTRAARKRENFHELKKTSLKIVHTHDTTMWMLSSRQLIIFQLSSLLSRPCYDVSWSLY